MLDLINSLAAVSGHARLIVDTAMYFGLFFIVVMSLNFQYGNAGVPNMGFAVSVMVGGLTVSAITTRLTFMLVKMAGVELLPYASDLDWLYNNEINVNVLTNGYLKTNPGLCIALLLFSLAVSIVLGAAIGWVISVPAIRLKPTYLMITLLTMTDASSIIGREIPALCGATLGMFVPDLLAFYHGDRAIILATLTLFIGLIAFLVFRTMLNSPLGRLMRVIRENETTAASVGKNVVGIKRNILMFASGITALAGTLLAFYFSFIVQANYSKPFWTYWPWFMLIIGGPGNNAGAFLGTTLVVALRRIIIVYKWELDKLLFFPITYFMNLLLSILMLIFMIFRPGGLIHEKPLHIPGINYSQLIREEVPVD